MLSAKDASGLAGRRSMLPARLPCVRTQFGWVDLVVAAAVLVVFYVAARVGARVAVSFIPNQPLHIDTDPARLPYYAVRSLLRMFAALAVAMVFTLVYGYAAARSRRLEKVLIPALDILQSVPILGFLTIAVTGFLALFPHSLLGPGMRRDLRDLHVVGVEHDLLLLPLADHPAPGAG
jgi:NitT/TauT family transport system permease protein